MSAPFHSTVPSVGFEMVARILISVDFPAPFGPSSPSTPGSSCSVKSRSAQTFPSYCLLTPWIPSFKPSSQPRSSHTDSCTVRQAVLLSVAGFYNPGTPPHRDLFLRGPATQATLRSPAAAAASIERAHFAGPARLHTTRVQPREQTDI